MRPRDSGRLSGAADARHGIAAVGSDHPAYQYMRDPDEGGVVCE